MRNCTRYTCIITTVVIYSAYIYVGLFNRRRIECAYIII